MLAERLRARIAELSVGHEEHVIRVTISIGVAELAEHQSGGDLLRAADTALYEAKRRGRDCVYVIDGTGRISLAPPVR